MIILLKVQKDYLVNITGGKDLKLFEVDEAVNKVRAEVDPEAELIIGAITDAELDGKMRVSIVATSLDGQQPETKSVINMVHRIQNRNPGYSDFSNIGSSASFNFSNTISNPVSHGANALKVENEIVQEHTQEQINSSVTNEEIFIAIVLKQKVLLKIVLLTKWKNLLLKKQWIQLKSKQLKRVFKRMFLMILKNLVLTQMHQIYLAQKLKIQVQMIYYLQVMKRMMILKYQRS
jgi:hypothetical protein